MCKISVIMLTYNREQLISKAIESILEQTFKDFEFIIVNNGSTDKSGIIAESYGRKDNRIKIINRSRGNIGSGRNSGLNVAKGEYITFIDDDDYAAPDMLEFLYNFAEKYNADIMTCGSYKIENNIIINNIVYDKLYIMNNVDATQAFLKRKIYNAGLPTKLVRKSLFQKVRFFEDGKYEDIRSTYRLFANANIVVAHGIPKYYVLRHPGNNSSEATKYELLNPVQLKEYLEAFQERTRYIKEILPELFDFSLYSEWSYMISMVEKIHKFELGNCNEILEFLEDELRSHYDEFFYGSYIKKFEKEWMKKYIN